MEHFRTDFDRIVFCVESESDFELYAKMFKFYFPRNAKEMHLAAMELPEDEGNEWGETVIEERVIRVGALGYDSPSQDEDEVGLALFRFCFFFPLPSPLPID